MSSETGVLSVVATPIGNLRDITLRALDVLAAVEWVAAEDTRHSRRLLDHYGLRARTVSLHEHNEAARIPRLLRLLQAGQAVALVSDAGTPLLSDPGGRLVAAAHEAGFAVVPIPGPSSLTAALSVAGLASAERFVFEGFLPAQRTARRRRLAALASEQRAVVLFEAPHRLLDTLTDLCELCGEQRQIVVARELTKVHETVLRGALQTVLESVAGDANQRRGEVVLVVAGVPAATAPETVAVEATDVLRALLQELPLKQAVRLAARLTGQRRNTLYQQALALAERE
ncbi:16S rRNA (cytidine(1402)-2'-O)-methyltransferase [Halorhodospira abdelmalekii]|uniref:16S rRNA (cytidine(1402)-2'-O)-methyltransferase n=1 Tax=Halorhodospira abdelmalekii TaxID=421629 RepID=UPI001908620D|nr:16S rRNA (cytidine(1402)-2'-O)-methyltransferase [Halorhodospira abdelmalekii]MBK1734107.1 16S rRNA (cytidine(1402)-2'-O)-methyltransferase [Halorhodospira abdelmalekii]